MEPRAWDGLLVIAFKVVDDISDDLVKRDNFFKIGAVLSTRGLVPWDMIDVDVLFVAFDFLKRFPLMPDLAHQTMPPLLQHSLHHHLSPNSRRKPLLSNLLNWHLYFAFSLILAAIFQLLLQQTWAERSLL